MSRGSILAPWDAIPYFQPVNETLVFASSNGNLLVAADPMRIYLGIAPQQNVLYYVSTLSINPLAQGYQVNGYGSMLEFFHYRHGNLVQQAFYCSSPPGGDYLTVVEVRLAKWPNTQG